MTDRLKGVWVAFDEDLRTDDAEPIIAAIQQLRHVQGVTVDLADPADWMNRLRVSADLKTKLWQVFDE